MKLFGLINLFFASLATLTYGYTNEALQDQVVNLPGLNYSSVPAFNQFSGYLDFGSFSSLLENDKSFSIGSFSSLLENDKSFSIGSFSSLLENGKSFSIGSFSSLLENDKSFSIGSKHIHYWFVESIKSPETAPLVFWTNGGPGCSGLLGFLTEQGPFRPMEDGSLVFNEWTWNQNANMVFIEQPVGVGFSYADNSEDYHIGDDQAAQDNVQVILKFLEKFPEYSKTPIYLTAESYGGHYIPTWADAILDYNSANPSSPINLAGFAVGNPYVDYWSGVGAQMEAYWDHQLIDQKSWAVYESNGCVTPAGFLNNSICSTLSLDFMRKIGSVNPYAPDYPVCLSAQQVYTLEFMWGLELGVRTKFLRGSSNPTLPYEPCEDSWTENYLNIPEVKSALHVKDIYWVECSRTTKYQLADKMKSTIHIYRKLIEQSKTKLNILIYSGDDDSVCATKYTNEWVYGLGYPASSNWKVWVDLDGQVAGYETIFKPASGNKFKFATVHGAGHEVPTYKPAQAFVLFESWLGLDLA